MYSERVSVALDIQQAMEMRPVVICGLFGSTVNCSNLTKKKKNSEHEMCVSFSVQGLSEIFLILERIMRDMIKNISYSSCKVTLIFVSYQRVLNILCRFSKNTQISNFIKSHPVRLKLLQRTGMMKLRVALRSFANAPKNCSNNIWLLCPLKRCKHRQYACSF